MAGRLAGHHHRQHPSHPDKRIGDCLYLNATGPESASKSTQQKTLSFGGDL
jgi:hypothetical protein